MTERRIFALLQYPPTRYPLIAKEQVSLQWEELASEKYEQCVAPGMHKVEQGIYSGTFLVQYR